MGLALMSQEKYISTWVKIIEKPLPRGPQSSIVDWQSQSNSLESSLRHKKDGK